MLVKNHHDSKKKGINIEYEDVKENKDFNEEKLTNFVVSLQIQEGHDANRNKNFSKESGFSLIYFKDYLLPF